MPKKRWPFWLAALIAGWAVDFLFWGHTPGISIPVWVAVILAAGIGAAWSEGVRPAGKNWILVVLAIGMASVVLIRRDPITMLVAFALSFAAHLHADLFVPKRFLGVLPLAGLHLERIASVGIH